MLILSATAPRVPFTTAWLGQSYQRCPPEGRLSSACTGQIGVDGGLGRRGSVCLLRGSPRELRSGSGGSRGPGGRAGVIGRAPGTPYHSRSRTRGHGLYSSRRRRLQAGLGRGGYPYSCPKWRCATPGPRTNIPKRVASCLTLLATCRRHRCAGLSPWIGIKYTARCRISALSPCAVYCCCHGVPVAAGTNPGKCPTACRTRRGSMGAALGLPTRAFMESQRSFPFPQFPMD